MNDTNSRLSPFPSNSMKKCSSNTSLQEVPTYEIRDVIESMRSLKPGDVQKLEEEMQEMKSKHEKMSERIRGNSNNCPYIDCKIVFHNLFGCASLTNQYIIHLSH